MCQELDSSRKKCLFLLYKYNDVNAGCFFIDTCDLLPEKKWEKICIADKICKWLIIITSLEEWFQCYIVLCKSQFIYCLVSQPKVYYVSKWNKIWNNVVVWTIYSIATRIFDVKLYGLFGTHSHYVQKSLAFSLGFYFVFLYDCCLGDGSNPLYQCT